MRKFATRLLCAALAGFSLGVVNAQGFPSKPVRLVVPFPPGGAFDILARSIAEEANKKWGQPVVVENRPGGNISIATDYVMRRPPDGHTLYLSGDSLVAYPIVTLQRADYDLTKDLTALAPISELVLMLIASPSFPPNSITELLDYIRKHPGKVNVGSWTVGGIQQLASATVANRAGATVTNIGYKGSSVAMPDLVAGRIDFFFNTPSALGSLTEAGKVKLLGVTSRRRLPQYPNVAAIGETIPGFDITSWSALFGPPGISEDLANRLNRDLTDVIVTPGVQGVLKRFGWVTTTGSRQEFHDQIRRTTADWKKAVAEGFKAEQ